MSLVNVSERIRSMELLAYLKADTQMQKTDNLVFEVSTMQKTLYGADFKRVKSSETKSELLLLIHHIEENYEIT